MSVTLVFVTEPARRGRTVKPLRIWLVGTGTVEPDLADGWAQASWAARP